LASERKLFRPKNRKTVSEKPAPRWWERIVVVLIIALAFTTARSAPAILGGSGSCSPKTLQSLARVYMAHGDYDKAQTLVNSALESVSTGEGNEEVKSSCLIDLAWIYKNQGQFPQAEQACRLGLELQQQFYYQDHPYVAYTLRILGSIYQHQAKYPQAGASLDRALNIIRKCHPADDPIVASFQVDIARLEMAEGKLAEAEMRFEQALVLISNYYGPDHLYTAAVYSDLAKLYYLQEKYDQAECLLNFAMSIQENVFGPDHRLLTGNWLTLAKIYHAKGDLPEAQRLLKRILSSVPSAEAFETLARLYLDTGQFAKAQDACFKAIDMFEKSAGPDSDLTAMAKNTLAKIYLVQGKFDESFDLACSALPAVETAFGPDHPSVASVAQTAQLARQLQTAQRLASAAPDTRIIAKADESSLNPLPSR